MIAYFFKFQDEGEDVGCVGFALAQNKKDMFWQIDSHGDPYDCLIQTVTNFSTCVSVTEYTTEGYSEIASVYDNHEHHYLPCLKDDAWRKPVWPK